jgi:hypothetical protein
MNVAMKRVDGQDEYRVILTADDPVKRHLIAAANLDSKGPLTLGARTLYFGGEEEYRQFDADLRMAEGGGCPMVIADPEDESPEEDNYDDDGDPEDKMYFRAERRHDERIDEMLTNWR